MIVLRFFCLLYNNLALSFLTKYNKDAAINIESCIIHTHWKYNIIRIWTNVYKNLQYSVIIFKLLIIINYFLNKSYIKFCMFQFFILPLFLFWLFKYILTQFHCQSTTVESAVALLNISWLNFLKLSNICKIYISYFVSFVLFLSVFIVLIDGEKNVQFAQHLSITVIIVNKEKRVWERWVMEWLSERILLYITLILWIHIFLIMLLTIFTYNLKKTTLNIGYYSPVKLKVICTDLCEFKILRVQ